MVITLNKKYLIFSLIALTAVTVLIINFYKTKKYKLNYENPPTEEYYVLKSEEKTLKLYKNNNLIETYNINPQILPLTDQDNLRTGIILYSMNEVRELLEDFDG